MGKAKKLCAPRPNPAQFQEGVTLPVRAEPLVLIVAPSRELATQIFNEARRFCYRTMFRPCVVYGGGPLPEQIAQLQKGCDILIGTPGKTNVRILSDDSRLTILTGRLIDFIGRPHLLTLKRLKYMVLDEADEMVSVCYSLKFVQVFSNFPQADWEAELSQIMGSGDQDEGNIVYMMFSATFPKAARDLAATHLKYVNHPTLCIDS